MWVSNNKPAALIMEANLSSEKKSTRAPLTKGCCWLAFPCMRPSAGQAQPYSATASDRLESVPGLLFCSPALNYSRPFQSKNSSVRGEVGGRERQGKRGRKEKGRNRGKMPMG